MVIELQLDSTDTRNRNGNAVLYPLGQVGTATLDWGDGTAPDAITFDGTNNPPIHHVYAGGGTFTITVTPQGVTHANVTSVTIRHR